MGDTETNTSTKKNALVNHDGSISLKKVLGGLAGIAFIVICCWKVVSLTEITDVVQILDQLKWFCVLCLGLKIASGVTSAVASNTK